MDKLNKIVSDLNKYSDGALPLARQRIRVPAVEILRCSFWALQVWHHRNLAASYWRLYWNPDRGGTVKFGGQYYELGPDQALLIAPNTAFGTRLKPLPGSGDGKDGQMPPLPQSGDGHSFPSSKMFFSSDHNATSAVALPEVAMGDENVMVGCPADADGIAGWGEGSPAEYVRHLFLHFRVGQPYDSIRPLVLELPLEPCLISMLGELADVLSRDRSELSCRHSLIQYSLIHYALSQVAEAAWPQRPDDRRVVRVLEYLERHFAEPLNNADFGRLARMSPNAFTRLFRGYVGQTPLQYLTARRIEQASVLLHHSDHSLERIADLCGFGDRNYFTRVFRSFYDMGPATFRRLRMA